MESQVKYSSLSQPPSIHASPINYNRTCNTTYTSPIGYQQANSPYDNYQFQNYENYPQNLNNNLNYQNIQPNNNQQQYNLTPNFNNPSYQQQTAVFGSNNPTNYSLNTSPLQTAGTEPYHHYGAQHQLPHSLHSVSQAQTHRFPFYDDPGE